MNGQLARDLSLVAVRGLARSTMLQLGGQVNSSDGLEVSSCQVSTAENTSNRSVQMMSQTDADLPRSERTLSRPSCSAELLAIVGRRTIGGHDNTEARAAANCLG